MDFDPNWISAIATSAAALFTLWTAKETANTAKETKRMAEQGTRPFLVITPAKMSLQLIHNPSVEVHNYGNGPAIIQSIRLFGVETSYDVFDPTGNGGSIQPSKNSVLIDTAGDIIPPDSKNQFEANDNYSVYFGYHPHVKFEVTYTDMTGNQFVSECLWQDGKWARRTD